MQRVLLFLGMGSRRSTKDKGTSTLPLLPASFPIGVTSTANSSLQPGNPLFDAMIVQSHKPDEILRMMFSTRACLSLPSFMPNEAQTGARQIGKGQCGTIWAVQDFILKVPNEGKQAQLWNDCCNHKRVEQAFQQAPWELRSNINIPRWETWVNPSRNSLWADCGGFFPERFQPTYGILSGRIQPLPLPICHALVDHFAPKSFLGNNISLLERPENQDCLVRLYLGRRADRSASTMFKLRNFDFMVDEMEGLSLDTAAYAKVMAQTLAVLHWRAGIDANDVEFVLGRSPKLMMAPTAADLESMGSEYPICNDVMKLDCRQGSLGIWLLDFDQCQTFSESDAGVKQLQRAFYFNDPYYPRPVSKDPRDVTLWKTFKNDYLEASTCLTASDMPRRFIEAVEAEGQRRGTGDFMFQ